MWYNSIRKELIMKKVKILTIAIVSLFSLIAVASATPYSSVAITLTKLGDYKRKSNSMEKGNIQLTANVYSQNDATLGLSADKKGLFGTYTFISRCNKSIASTVSVSCTWNNQSAGEYRGTTVLNTVGPNFTAPVEGYMYWTDKV